MIELVFMLLLQAPPRPKCDPSEVTRLALIHFKDYHGERSTLSTSGRVATEPIQWSPGIDNMPSYTPMGQTLTLEQEIEALKERISERDRQREINRLRDIEEARQEADYEAFRVAVRACGGAR